MISRTLPGSQDRVLPSDGSKDMTDEHLLSLYRSTREDQLFAQLVQRHERPLYRYLRRFLGDGTVAHDVLQSTLLKVHQNCNQFDARREFRPWLYRIATNQAIDEKRRRQLRQMSSLDASRPSGHSEARWSFGDLVDDGQRSPAAQVETRERDASIRRAVEKLPERLKQVVRLVFFRGLKYQEAADALSLPVGTVKSRMHAAIVKLRAMWSDTQRHRFELDY
jgi:RNA polymerase sigma-70 factor (ECF subfamily)